MRHARCVLSLLVSQDRHCQFWHDGVDLLGQLGDEELDREKIGNVRLRLWWLDGRGRNRGF